MAADNLSFLLPLPKQGVVALVWLCRSHHSRHASSLCCNIRSFLTIKKWVQVDHGEMVSLRFLRWRRLFCGLHQTTRLLSVCREALPKR